MKTLWVVPVLMLAACAQEPAATATATTEAKQEAAPKKYNNVEELCSDFVDAIVEKGKDMTAEERRTLSQNKQASCDCWIGIMYKHGFKGIEGFKSVFQTDPEHNEVFWDDINKTCAPIEMGLK